MMRRREALAIGGLGLPVILSGCVRAPGGSSADGVPVTVTARDDQPAAPLEYAVELVNPVATSTRPARLRVSLTNPSEAPVVLGEERAVQFHHVASNDDALYLHPAGDASWAGPVEPGCWQLTEFVPVPEYYGTVSIESGETLRADSYIYGHPELPDGSCLPAGEHRLDSKGIAGDDESAIFDGTDVTEFEWGFTLGVGD